jgi:hypothetical protein
MRKTVVTRVEATSAYRLRITFADGFSAEIDLQPALRGAAFESLMEESLFRKVAIGYDTISWPNGADIAPETLRYWCELGRVATQEEGDRYFFERQNTARVAEEK